jgi:hypothetical protein
MTSSDHASPAAAPTLDDIARDQHRPITAAVQADCQRLQALEDAIAYRPGGHHPGAPGSQRGHQGRECSVITEWPSSAKKATSRADVA